MKIPPAPQRRTKSKLENEKKVTYLKRITKLCARCNRTLFRQNVGSTLNLRASVLQNDSHSFVILVAFTLKAMIHIHQFYVFCPTKLLYDPYQSSLCAKDVMKDKCKISCPVLSQVVGNRLRCDKEK